MMYACFQVDIRAFYHLVDGLITEQKNNSLLLVGLVATVCLPAIGFFDEKAYYNLHCLISLIYFISTAFYSWNMSGILSDNKIKFPASMWTGIYILGKLRIIMVGCLGAFLYFATT
mmetsp:Transcript_20404/g.19383  ORF Transcript_20404/g.19383 Transcript_20404/m.19383 type:complete len:116 (-) Transcript_20404:231-578(-)